MKVDHRIRRMVFSDVLMQSGAGPSTPIAYASLTTQWEAAGLRKMDLQLSIEDLSAAGLIRVDYAPGEGDWLVVLTPLGARHFRRRSAWSWTGLRSRLSIRRARLRARRRRALLRQPGHDELERRHAY